jgi:hypothetical protein
MAKLMTIAHVHETMLKMLVIYPALATDSWNTTWRYDEYIIRYELIIPVST